MQMDKDEDNYIRKSILITLAAIGYAGYADANSAAADDSRLRKCFETLLTSLSEDGDAMVAKAADEAQGDAAYISIFRNSVQLASVRIPGILDRFRSSPSPFRTAGWMRLCASVKGVARLIEVDRELLELITEALDIYAEEDTDIFPIRSAGLPKIFDALERLTAVRASILLPYLV